MLKKADIGVGLYLLAAVVFFIVPIPSVLLDVMLAFNISIALIIVFNVLFVREVLDMSFFPTLLLFTTIFRISLNVSSTRLILLTGDPGNVVKTFGSFVGAFASCMESVRPVWPPKPERMLSGFSFSMMRLMVGSVSGSM